MRKQKPLKAHDIVNLDFRRFWFCDWIASGVIFEKKKYFERQMYNKRVSSETGILSNAP